MPRIEYFAVPSSSYAKDCTRFEPQNVPQPAQTLGVMPRNTLVMCSLLMPAIKSTAGRSPSSQDWALAAVSVVVCGYFYLHAYSIVLRN